MATKSQSVTIYVCDSCAKEIVLEGVHGLSAPFPTGWKTIQPGGPESDAFCSWECLSAYAKMRGEERATRDKTRKAK